MCSDFPRRMSSTVATVVVVSFFLSPNWTQLAGNALGGGSSLQLFNKTVRDEVRLKVWLDKLKKKIQRNATPTPSPRTQTEKPNHNPQVPPPPYPYAPPGNGSVRGNTPNIQDKYRQAGRHVPSMIKSNVIEKNVITFNLSQENFSETNLVTRVNLFVFIWKREPKGKKKASNMSPKLLSTRSGLSASEVKKNRNRRRNRRNRMIKIIVFLMDQQRNGRGRRIAELKRRVKISQWQRIGLPVSLIKSLSQMPTDSTLRLRVECRRCTRKTVLYLPWKTKSRRCGRRGRSKRKDRKSKRTSGRKGRRGRKKCSRITPENGESKKPFIIIEDKPKSTRFKRSSLGSTESSCPQDSQTSQSIVPQNSHPFRNKSLSSNTNSRQSCCKKFTTYVNFGELNLESTIVYPSGFSMVTCVGTCVVETSTSSADAHSSSNHTLPNSLHRLLHKDKDRPPSSHLPWSSTQAHSLGVQNGASTGAPPVNGRKGNRLKKVTPCVPTKTTGLNIIYFAHDNSLLQSEIPNVLVTDCGCNSHRTKTT